tara:strand:- start:154 stop:309 length:156 start_codon:yes stop_codon:yes gene_type:complete
MSEKKKEKTPNTLQDQAWKRAKENKEPRTGYPWDWLDYEDIKKEEEKNDQR